jgi:hypothetical protein
VGGAGVMNAGTITTLLRSQSGVCRIPLRANGERPRR